MQMAKKDNNQESVNQKQVKKLTKKGKRGLIIAGSIVLVVGAVTAIIVPTVSYNLKHNISYQCDGVDSGWLEFHPFDVSDYPTSFKRATKTIELDHPSIPGYEFTGWYLMGREQPVFIEDNVFHADKYKGDVSLVARYQIITYKVTLLLNGGKLTDVVNDVYEGHRYVVNGDTVSTTFNCLDEPFKYPKAERTGYDFLPNGWKNFETGVTYEGCDTSNLNNVSLTTDWTIHPYVVSYSFEGEGVSEFENEVINNNVHSSDVEHEMVLVKPYLKGYEFVEWLDSKGNPITKVDFNTFPSNDDLHLVGKFKPVTYTISYSDESDSDHSLLPTEYKRCSSDVSIPDINPRGYRFLGWLSSNSTSYVYENVIPHNSTGNIIFTADVELLTYHITFNTSGVSDDFVDTFNLKNESITYTVRKADFSLPTASVPGYRFLGYIDEYGENVNPLIETGSMIGDKVYTAKFEPIDYTITMVNTRKNTTITKTYNIESHFAIEDVSSTGYTFNGWIDDNGIKRTAIAIGDALSLQDFTLTTSWTLNIYNITYSYNGLGEGVEITNNNPVTYNYETDVVLAQPSVTGYEFIGWTSATSSTPSLNYSIPKHTETGDLELVANFEKIRYTIKRSYNVNAVGSLVTETTDYYVDTPEFTLPNIASDTRQFVGWKERTTNRLYTGSSVFGGGRIGNYNLDAVWAYKGSGTESDPYQIYDADQLEGIQELNKHYILMNDITIAADANDAWRPVGTSSTPFAGEFNGNNKTISLVISANSKDNFDFVNYFGIFGYCSVVSNIHDFTITGSIGAADNRLPTNLFGIVAASSAGTISNCESSVRSYITSYSTVKAIAGGIVGVSSPANISNSGCTGSGILNISAPNTLVVSVGGVAGQVSGGILDNCYNRANVISLAYNTSYAGGLVGENDYTSCAHISWNENPATSNPFTGSVNSSVIVSEGNPGMAQYSTTYCITGNQAYSMESSNTETFEAGVYYYIVVINSAHTKAAMTWGLYNGTDFTFNADDPYFISYSLE